MPERILIVDDEPSIVISLEYLMKREGYTVSVARDGDEAIAAILRDRPALVLLEIVQVIWAREDQGGLLRTAEVLPLCVCGGPGLGRRHGGVASRVREARLARPVAPAHRRAT